MASLDSLLRFAVHLRIAHHIPGRVRLKLAPEGGAGLAVAVTEAKRFVQSMMSIPGIHSVKLNPLAQSCVIEYDPQIIPPSVWQDLVSGTRSAAVDMFLQALMGPGYQLACS